MPASPERIASLQSKIWSGSLPLEIRLAASDCRTYTDSDPYLIQYPRLSYLAFLLPRLHAFFAPWLINPDVPAHEAWLSFEEVPLKWHYPAGLLYDLYSGAEPVNIDRRLEKEEASASSHADVEGAGGSGSIPWRLTIHYTDFPDGQLIPLDVEEKTMRDTFTNAMKEADFVRNGTARTAMSLSKQDSNSLWQAVQSHDRALFNTINTKLLNPPGLELRHVPLKIYLPTSASRTTSAPETIPEEGTPTAGHIRVVQALIPIQQSSSRQPQTLGTALNSTLPAIFPSRRNPLLAQPVLHGAAAPMTANLAELSRAAAYTDGFLHMAIVMLG
ncbi:Autophagy protein 5 [Friedmanniomyces endolithicus]|nr:Autophagy protein 5 [Friedmanniomyces endolithicus]KAK0780576.1 Autophagy protein 5 [Friedmanniomyces endolithicus]KAK0788077.1 Autophagy protein 5 [Friedmanniomyces endolithicus]KAK0808815.1 Autophagy protein 5 [Friedmanniomyces endolithicus]KAK0840841.1 Autophagy protein 5 [Friedmanniomyces endolithicus]